MTLDIGVLKRVAKLLAKLSKIKSGQEICATAKEDICGTVLDIQDAVQRQEHQI